MTVLEFDNPNDDSEHVGLSSSSEDDDDANLAAATRQASYVEQSVQGGGTRGLIESRLQRNYNNNHYSSDGNHHQLDENDPRIQKWKESPFAVGLTHATWRDEKPSLCSCCVIENRLEDDAIGSTAGVSAIFCRPCGRVGNMVILHQSNEVYEDPITGEMKDRPRIHCILGPYWMCFGLVTLPAFGMLSIWAGMVKISELREDGNVGVVITWLACNAVLFISLFNVSCRDPGILYRHTQKPNDNWIWNDQAMTYRPKSARYDSECAVIIEDFDHVCPWTGTAIGKNNMIWFRIFVVFVFLTILYDVILLSSIAIF